MMGVQCWGTQGSSGGAQVISHEGLVAVLAGAPWMQQRLPPLGDHKNRRWELMGCSQGLVFAKE
jgi:hypothetical protein